MKCENTSCKKPSAVKRDGSRWIFCRACWWMYDFGKRAGVTSAREAMREAIGAMTEGKVRDIIENEQSMRQLRGGGS